MNSPPANLLLHATDWALLLFHCALIGFNCFGMFWKRTRLANLVTLLLTGFSWTVLGLWYGFGYCPLTDWHWQVKEQLGVRDLPHSYLKWLADAPTGWDVDPMLVDVIAGIVFASSVLLSLYLNIRYWRRG